MLLTSNKPTIISVLFLPTQMSVSTSFIYQSFMSMETRICMVGILAAPPGVKGEEFNNLISVFTFSMQSLIRIGFLVCNFFNF